MTDPEPGTITIEFHADEIRAAARRCRWRIAGRIVAVAWLIAFPLVAMALPLPLAILAVASAFVYPTRLMLEHIAGGFMELGAFRRLLARSGA